jgi:hypothetical protein
MLKTREAEIDDAKDIARVHVECWMSCYSFISPRIHELRSLEFREKQWVNIIKSDEYSIKPIVITDDDVIVGFCFAKQNDDPDIDADVELHACYVLAEYRGGLAGPMVIRSMIERVIGMKYRRASVWVFDQNPMKRTYFFAGLKIKVRRDRILYGENISEIGLICSDLPKLIEKIDRVIAQSVLCAPFENRSRFESPALRSARIWKYIYRAQ